MKIKSDITAIYEVHIVIPPELSKYLLFNGVEALAFRDYEHKYSDGCLNSNWNWHFMNSTWGTHVGAYLYQSTIVEYIESLAVRANIS